MDQYNWTEPSLKAVKNYTKTGGGPAATEFGVKLHFYFIYFGEKRKMQMIIIILIIIRQGHSDRYEKRFNRTLLEMINYFRDLKIISSKKSFQGKPRFRRIDVHQSHLLFSLLPKTD